MLLSPQLLCLLGLMALGTVHATPWAEERLDRGSCPMFWVGFNGRCYKYIPVNLSWNQAQRNCRETYSHPELICDLASIRSQEEHDFVLSLIPEYDELQPASHKGDTWIGLNDIYTDGGWMWSDGSRTDYTPWGADMPRVSTGYNCVYTTRGGQWYDHPCSLDLRSVCVLRTQTSCY